MFVRMLIPIQSRSSSSSKVGHVESKIRSLGQILEKPCVHSRGHRFEQNFTKLCQNVNSHKSRSSSKLGHVGSKTRSLGHIMKKKTCVQSRGHSFDQMLMKLCQNVNSHKIWVNFEALKHSTCDNADSSVAQFLKIMTTLTLSFLCQHQ